MKELNVKSILGDPNVPYYYKLGNRVHPYFLAGIEYVITAIEKKGIELWAAMDSDNKDRIYVFDEEPKCNEGVWEATWSYKVILNPKDFPEITFESSPKKIRIFVED